MVKLLCSFGAGPRAEAATQAERAGHAPLARWLELSEEWTTPLHYTRAVTPARAFRLLRDGADLHACAYPGRPTPLSLDRGEAPPGSTAEMILAAAAPWSTETHQLFPHDSRERAVELTMLGYQLSRSAPAFAGREQALIDAWMMSVMPEAIER